MKSQIIYRHDQNKIYWLCNDLKQDIFHFDCYIITVNLFIFKHLIISSTLNYLNSLNKLSRHLKLFNHFWGKQFKNQQ